MGILGNRDDNNSYAPTPFTSDINGIPVTLERLGMQYNISSNSPQNLWTEANANLSRVWMYYDANYTFSISQTWLGGTNYSFSNGSGASSLSVWDYGDGSPLDTAFNPTHDFVNPGNYTVCSYITGNCLSDTVCTNVIICPAPALSDYTYTINYPSVDFTDVSQNTTTWAWDFGDGSPIDNSQNPTHTYANLGLYNVCLTVVDTCGGTNTHCENISVCPALLPITLGSDVVACGSATLSLQGNYSTYSWSNSTSTPTTTVTTDGSYSVVVTDANGCSGTDTVLVDINPLPLEPFANDSASICGGLTIILDALNSGSSYAWSTGSTSQTLAVTTSGVYSVVITNNFGCTISDAVTATVFPIPNLFLGNDLNICQGTVSIDAGNLGSTFIWNTGATTHNIFVNSGGSYSVVVTDVNGCTNTDTINIVMNAPPVSYVETQSLVCINAGPITLTPGTPAGGTYSGPGVTGNQFNPLVAGLGNKNVIYSYTDTAGCTGKDTSVIVVDACSGLNELNSDGVRVYPNPVKNTLFIESNLLAGGSVIIYSLDGKIIQKQSFTGTMNTELLNQGAYFIELMDKNATLISRKIFVKE